MKKKFELTEETKIVNNVTLHRIRALRDVFNFKKGKLGGWIEKEKNLSHEGECWVFDNACVMNDASVSDNSLMYGNAQMSGNARMGGNSRMYDDAVMLDNAQMFDESCMLDNSQMSGNAQMWGNVYMMGNAHMAGNGTISTSTDVLCFTNVGSEHGSLTVYKAKEGIEVTSWGFQGTDIEFLNAVKEKHGLDSKIGKEYSMMIELAGFRILG